MSQEVTRKEFDTLADDFGTMKKLLVGNGKIGMFGKMQIVWRTWVALLCLLSFIAGTFFQAVVSKYLNN